MRIAVIGGGVAGTAAAWAARRAGAEVSVFFDRPGASSLYSGALDVSSWEQDPRDAPIPAGAMAFAAVFDAWSLGTRSCRVATHEGVLRPARGVDAALLDLTSLAGKTVGIADCPVAGWDSAALSRALDVSRYAAQTKTRFKSVKVPGVVDPDESCASSFDVAALHDAEERVARLAACLDGTGAAVDGWLLGPWLGTVPGAAERLRARIHKPCGETTSPPGGPAGARFESARDALFSSMGVRTHHEHIATLEVREGRLHALHAMGANGGSAVGAPGFDALIVAIGGLVGGGVELTAEGFRLSIRAPLMVGLGGSVLGPPSSAYGVDIAGLGPFALERVGILANGARARGMDGVSNRLFVAGDCVEGRPRAALEAATAGIAAADQAVKV